MEATYEVPVAEFDRHLRVRCAMTRMDGWPVAAMPQCRNDPETSREEQKFQGRFFKKTRDIGGQHGS